MWLMNGERLCSLSLSGQICLRQQKAVTVEPGIHEPNLPSRLAFTVTVSPTTPEQHERYSRVLVKHSIWSKSAAKMYCIDDDKPFVIILEQTTPIRIEMF